MYVRGQAPRGESGRRHHGGDLRGDQIGTEGIEEFQVELHVAAARGDVEGVHREDVRPGDEELLRLGELELDKLAGLVRATRGLVGR